MPKTIDELERKVLCICIELPCVHNPEVSDDIAIEVAFKGHVTRKGVTYIFIDKKKFHVVEEAAGIMRVKIDK